MANYSPSHTKSIPVDAYYGWERYQSATPASSPQGHSFYHHLRAPPQWPTTRAHVCNASIDFSEFTSPWYTSDGYYTAANMNWDYNLHKSSWATLPQSNYERRFSYANLRTSTPYKESVEDEVIDIHGRTYMLPAQSSRQRTNGLSIPDTCSCEEARNRCATGYHNPITSKFAYIKRDAPADELHHRRPAARTRTHRSSYSIPQRPSTTRPVSFHTKRPPPAFRATEADAKKYQIPISYSLKNWDPLEEPILLLGSVFDANSLGKWIYDWTVYRYGPATPISDIAGELWILLIQLADKAKRAEVVVNGIQSAKNRKLIDGFINSRRYLTDKFGKLLKTCESSMLKVCGKKGNIQLVKNAGIVFVETLFGRERELDKTERFMQGVRLFNLEFDSNYEDSLRNPMQ